YALDVSKHPTVLISWAMVDLARKLFAVSAGLRSGVPAGVLAKDLKLWGASQGMIEAKARQLDPRMAADLLHAAVEGDAKQKSGVGEPEQILERLALKFAGLPT